LNETPSNLVSQWTLTSQLALGPPFLRCQ